MGLFSPGSLPALAATDWLLNDRAAQDKALAVSSTQSCRLGGNCRKSPLISASVFSKSIPQLLF
jgi:hypothetical protein